MERTWSIKQKCKLNSRVHKYILTKTRAWNQILGTLLIFMWLPIIFNEIFYGEGYILCVCLTLVYVLFEILIRCVENSWNYVPEYWIWTGFIMFFIWGNYLIYPYITNTEIFILIIFVNSALLALFVPFINYCIDKY